MSYLRLALRAFTRLWAFVFAAPKRDEVLLEQIWRLDTLQQRDDGTQRWIPCGYRANRERALMLAVPGSKHRLVREGHYVEVTENRGKNR